MSDDNEFIQLLSLDTPLLKNGNDDLLIEMLTDKTELNEEDYNALWNTLGFESSEDFQVFIETRNNLSDIIFERYPAFSNNFEDTKNLMTSFFESHPELIPTGPEPSTSNPQLCREMWKNCRAEAGITYTAEILGCSAGALGLGSLSFGVGGVIFQLACGGVALKHLSIMRKGCDLNLQQCMEN